MTFFHNSASIAMVSSVVEEVTTESKIAALPVEEAATTEFEEMQPTVNEKKEVVEEEVAKESKKAAPPVEVATEEAQQEQTTEISYCDDYASAISKVLGRVYEATDVVQSAGGRIITGETLASLTGDELKSVFPIKVKKANSPLHSNSWLLDPDLAEATVAFSSVMDKMATVEQWTSENDAFWHKLRNVETAHPAMAQALELTPARRNAGRARADLDGARQKISDELELRLRHLQKIGNEVIDRHLQVGDLPNQLDLEQNFTEIDEESINRDNEHDIKPGKPRLEVSNVPLNQEQAGRKDKRRLQADEGESSIVRHTDAQASMPAAQTSGVSSAPSAQRLANRPSSFYGARLQGAISASSTDAAPEWHRSYLAQREDIYSPAAPEWHRIYLAQREDIYSQPCNMPLEIRRTANRERRPNPAWTD